MFNSKTILLLGLTSSLVLWQNCGKVNFASEDGASMSLGSDLIQGDGLLLETPYDPQDENAADLAEDVEEILTDVDQMPNSGGDGTPTAGNDTGSQTDGGVAAPPASDEAKQEIVEVLMDNDACLEVFSKIDTTAYSLRASFVANGISGNIQIANVDQLIVSGISASIAGKNVGRADISGIHGSICLQAEEIGSITGVKGHNGHLAFFGPEGRLGTAERLVGVSGADMVIVGFSVERITGVGRSLHIYGGRVGQITGVFNEIHLYGGAQVENVTGISAGITIH